MDNINKIIEHEEGTLTQEEDIKLFQCLIDSGQCWSLQGHYGRTAMGYIEAGLCTLGDKGHRDYYGNYSPSKHEVEKGTKGSQEYCDNLKNQWLLVVAR